jgi:hypothetical protein
MQRNTGICGKSERNNQRRHYMKQNEARRSENKQDEPNAANGTKRSEAKQKEEGRSKLKPAWATQ